MQWGAAELATTRTSPRNSYTICTAEHMNGPQVAIDERKHTKPRAHKRSPTCRMHSHTHPPAHTYIAARKHAYPSSPPPAKSQVHKPTSARKYDCVHPAPP
jgi:hypothetical protein